MGREMKVQELLSQRLKDNGHGPFLFLGSGFSRRYVGLESWEELLRRFCRNIKEFEYYLSSADARLPFTATLMAADYKEYWWASGETAGEREKFKSTARFLSSPLKISIAEHVKTISSRKASPEDPFADELAELRKANVDGIITTNWDLLSESLFPDYKVFIGQEELLISTPQNLGEIYKIHGCCTKPNSLIVTDEDYRLFDERNPYLAAKLVTIFVENPVIFMGYSLNDPNVRLLLSSIVRGIGARNIDRITQNLIFVQRQNDDRPYGVRETVYALGDAEIPVTLLVTSDYSEIYRALQSVEHKIPVRILRYCKQQLYELVRDTRPSDQLCVVDFEDLDDSSPVEFVIGVGISDRLAAKGYEQVTLEDLFKDIVFGQGGFDPKMLLDKIIPSHCRYTKYVPVFKYLRALGIKCLKDYSEAGLCLKCVDKFDIKDFRYPQYARFFARECDAMNVGEIVANFDPDKAALLIPFIDWKEVNRDVLKDFIVKHIERVNGKVSRYSTYYRKLVCMYDAIVSGWVI